MLSLAAPPSGRTNGYLMGMAWSGSYGVGDTDDFAGDPSWRGLGVDLRSLRSERTSLGVYLAFNAFYNKTSEVAEIPGQSGHVAGTQFRYLNVFPVLVTGHYYLGRTPDSGVYLGGGAGVYPAEYRLDLGTQKYQETLWYPGLMPEAGWIFPLGTSARGYVNLKFHYGIATSKNDPSLSYLSLGVGLMDF